MAMDDTDQVLVKGLIGFGLLAGVLYFYPFSVPAEGFRKQVQKVEEARTTLRPKFDDYAKYYPVPSREVIGEPDASSPIGVVKVAQISERMREYRRKSDELRRLILEKQNASRMNFAVWTKVPEEEDTPGFYFRRVWDRTRLRLEDDARRKNVDIEDRDIGFGKYSGDLRMPRERARELLRQLFIAEKVIQLCMSAKVEQEQIEQKKGVRPEAFMRIISVMPEDPVKIGPYSRSPNPKYDKNERNPKSASYQKYITREWDKFIRMYPVEIRLQCDVNSFRNFLNSVRKQKGNFLVIRNLEIVSPFMKESLADQTEFNRLAPGNLDESDYKKEHIWIKLSAAGMDFFEPIKKERKATVKEKDGKPKRGVPMGY